MSVFRTAGHIYAQVIDDATGTTLATAGTLSPDLRDAVKEGSKTDSAKKVGALIAKICLEKKIEKIVFDRNGYLYHGRVKALAEAAREAGLQF
jgi:large subunit ribosomal protein L18